MTKDEEAHRDDLPDDRLPAPDDDAEEPTPLAGIGEALRRLRMRRGFRQYEAAEAAGITKAMLSAYETGKRRPSLKTLDSLLQAMGSHLGDLHRAMMAERYRYPSPGQGGDVEVREAPGPGWPASPRGLAPDLYALLGLDAPLPLEEERALEEMLRGFLKLLRFMHRSVAADGGRSAGPYDGV